MAQTYKANGSYGCVTVNDGAKVPNFAIRRVRELERQETRAEFADAMTRKAEELGESVSPSERYVARLEDGDIRCPYPSYRRVLTELCGRSITDLGFAPPSSERRLADVRYSAVRPSETPQQAYQSTLPSTGLQQMEMLRRSIEAGIGGMALTGAEVEDWELTVARHGRATRYQEPAILLTDLAADLSDVSQLLSSSHSASAVRRLTRVIAQMSGLVCLMLVKLEDRTAFRKWARTARIAADEAGDPLTSAWIRAQESYGYYYSGDLLEAVSVARDAQHIARGRPCVGSALAAALEARALARLGTYSAGEAQEAIRRAEAILGGLDTSETVPSAFGYTEAQLRFHEGSTYTHLRDTSAAWAAQKRSLELTPTNDYTDRTLTHLDRAICLAHDGDSSAAVTYAADALGALAERQRIGIITQRAREIVLAIPRADRALPTVREFGDFVHPPDGK